MNTTKTTTPTAAIPNATRSWSDIRGLIKTRWSKFSDSDLENFNGHMDRIVDGVQKVYALPKEKAELEYADFQKSLAMSPSVAEKSRPN